MKDVNNMRKRSWYDRRSSSGRRGRWWTFFFRSKVSENKRLQDDRRELPEKRCDWERISKWSSAPKINPYRYPYLQSGDHISGYPFL